MRMLLFCLAGLLCGRASVSLAAAAEGYPWDIRWETRLDQSYGPAPEETADLLLPRLGTRPAILFIHGGGWTAGDKSVYAYYAGLYARAGFAVVNLNYRKARLDDPASQWPAQVQDVQLALRWVRANAKKFGIDPGRICAMGDSAGGQLAMMLGYSRRAFPGDRSGLFPGQGWENEARPPLACVINLFGPADLTHPDFAKFFANGHPLFGGRSFEQAPRPFLEASPFYLIDSGSPPTFVVQGMKDNLVPRSLSDKLDDRLSRYEVEHVYRRLDCGHDFDGIAEKAKNAIDEEVLEFALRHVLP